MRTKLEDHIDKEFEEMDTNPWVYHVKTLEYFGGITVVDDSRHDTDDINSMVYEIEHECNDDASTISAPSTWMRTQLAKRGFYGIAICDWRDTFSRKRGRVISKGRLLKHLKSGA